MKQITDEDIEKAAWEVYPGIAYMPERGAMIQGAKWARDQRQNSPSVSIEKADKELTRLIDLLRECFYAGEDHATHTNEPGVKKYYPDFKKWIEDNDNLIKQCLKREV